jgi:hypothetical protein
MLLEQLSIFAVGEQTKTGGATFSEDRKYRYVLWRELGGDGPAIAFIGLNPSRAGEDKNDPTITRVMAFARRWGYSRVYMLNLFAWITPYPNELLQAEDPLGESDWWLGWVKDKVETVVFAWGSFSQAQERASQVVEKFPVAFALKLNKGGAPHHPLRLPNDINLIPYGQNRIADK